MTTGTVGEDVSSRPRHAPLRVLHLSDLALRASSTAAGPPSRAERELEALLQDLRHLPPLDLVVVSGDVSADGATTTYAAARRAVGALAEQHGAPHVYAVGDRDDHDRFAEVLGSGHLGPDGLDYGRSGPSAERHGWVSDVDGLRVVTVDSTVPGARHGVLGEDQAQWLSGVLAQRSPLGTLLVLHHPPVGPGGFEHLGTRLLHDGERLAAALAGSDVRAVLAGHLRTPLTAQLAGVPLLVAPGVVERVDLTAPAHLERVVPGGGALVVELGPGPAVVSYPVRSRSRSAPDRAALTDARTGLTVSHEDGAPTVVGVADGRRLSSRIPEGESPPAAPALEGDAADAWPDGLDSSTRSVQREPGEGSADAAPVWLDDPDEPLPEASSPEDSGVLSWAFGDGATGSRGERV